MSGAQEFERVLDGSDKNVASFEHNDVSLLKRVQHFLHSTPAAVPLIVLVLAIVIFGIAIGGRFFSAYTLTLILQQIAIVGILGAAQTLVILTAGIDLSIGVIMVISSVVMGNVAVTYGLPTPVAIVAGLVVGGICGLLNGFLVANMKLPPFIVTLGTWNIVMATNFIYSANETIRDTDVDEKAPLLHLFAASFRVGGAVLTLGVIAMVLLVIGLWYVLNHTAWGRHVYAVGDDPEAAKLAGIQTKKVLLAVYGVSGLIAALAAWVSIGRNGSVSPSSAVTDFNLQAITATVIGGISLFGGRGSILGTLFGAMIVGVVSMGLNMLGADPQWKVLLTGVLIIGAVAIDQWIRKVSA
ncbi:mannose ABC transporter membrane protein /fructose ABC transporter membrane protein /ribose ABC transporter membrane protein [Rhizobium sp. ERR 922]|uniref:ABC transporter permease n=1 Tax=unclassified Rhizobium TaxID=2613769 RepID=UPI000DDF4FFD|nr:MULTISPECIES: ABC transporter permease [unclassified Rhizobium]TWB16201.1 mannose ABC transporter membrane protein /fructose ABC transporter membrane protein /ribose ABC transporter membrane protein [Rhizobium sp. ERR1071]TWB50215.1 mannose ABC transporter membrane protein /fructose ABC transporter membrane protein /ribose ABC transporter membrane protein [Rhizobium sp. ERR 922]TWB92595.1 mannose ABC transporter membrane protein /fructose ABC transporter membrane protein /ribose ABC transport